MLSQLKSEVQEAGQWGDTTISGELLSYLAISPEKVVDYSSDVSFRFKILNNVNSGCV